MNPTAGTAAASPPRLITWLGYIAVALLLALPAAVLTVRSGIWQQGLLLYAIACLGAGLILLLCLLLLVLPRFKTWRKAIGWRALAALPGSLLLLSILGGGDYPPIHDISTDLLDPPQFTAAVQQREPGSNSLDLVEETIASQAMAYPGLKTFHSQASEAEVFNRAVQVATGMGWQIYRQDRNAGFIEAVDTTPIMAFKDDIVIRIRTNAEGTLVDVRSVSRVGVGDMGANAKRISAFLERLEQG